MTPELRAAVREMCLNGRSLAVLLDVGEDTVSTWGKLRRGRVQTEPLWVWHLIRAWQASPGLLMEALVVSHRVAEERSRGTRKRRGD